LEWRNFLGLPLAAMPAAESHASTPHPPLIQTLASSESS